MRRFSFLFIALVVSGIVLFSCKTQTAPADIEQAIYRAVAFIGSAQAPWGGFPTDRCLDETMQGLCKNDRTLFVSVLTGLSLLNAPSEKTKPILARIGALLSAQQAQNGAWEFYFRQQGSLPRNYFPDLDDTTLIGWYLQKANVTFNTNGMQKAIADNREKGLFLTFLREHQAPPPQTGNIDPVVNAQVMMVTGTYEDAVCGFVNDAIANKPLPSIYYRDRVVLFYVLSRAYANGVTCIKKSIDLLYEEALSTQKTDGSFGTPLQTAVFITAALNSGRAEKEVVGKATAALLRTQSKDGGWPSGFFFHGGDPNFFYGSRALTTALAIEALGKARSFNSNR